MFSYNNGTKLDSLWIWLCNPMNCLQTPNSQVCQMTNRQTSQRTIIPAYAWSFLWSQLPREPHSLEQNHDGPSPDDLFISSPSKPSQSQEPNEGRKGAQASISEGSATTMPSVFGADSILLCLQWDPWFQDLGRWPWAFLSVHITWKEGRWTHGGAHSDN